MTRKMMQKKGKPIVKMTRKMMLEKER